MNKIDIRSELIQLCKASLHKDIELFEKEIKEAQEEANFHKGAMQSRYDTFKEEAQAKKNGLLRQLHEKNRLAALINSIKTTHPYDKVELGAIVETDYGNYFISAFICDDLIIVNNKEFLTISLASPLGKALLQRSKGDIVEFNTQKIMIEDVY